MFLIERGGGGGGSAGNILATMLLHVSFPLILTFCPSCYGQWTGGVVCWQNICYHVAAM